MRITVKSVNIVADACPELTRFCLEFPTTGTESEAFGLRFVGWLQAKERAVKHVSFDCNSHPLESAAIGPRPDVIRAFPDDDASLAGGFEAAVPITDATGAMTLHIMVHFGESAACAASVDLFISPLRLAYEPQRSPILLTSPGRSGSSLGMNLMAQHPEVIAHGEFPFENKAALYWVHAAFVLTMPSDLARSTRGFTFEANRFTIGFNPFVAIEYKHAGAAARWYRETAPMLVYTRVAEIIDSYYTAAAADCGKDEASYFIEKSFHRLLPPIVRELYPGGKEIFLIRDPRDMYVSICSFHRKWGYTRYIDGGEFADEHEHIVYLQGRLDDFIADWQKRKASSLLVRYEDLIAKPHEVAKRIFSYLDIPSDDGTIGHAVARAFKETQRIKEHATSQSADESVGRWRTELPSELQGCCTSAFASAIEYFGYAE